MKASKQPIWVKGQKKAVRGVETRQRVKPFNQCSCLNCVKKAAEYSGSRCEKQEQKNSTLTPMVLAVALSSILFLVQECFYGLPSAS